MSGYEMEYEYRGLMAGTWDLLRGDTSGWADREFYLQLIRRAGQPVLDVGCGTGRLLLDYLGAGIDIDGVDNSPEMLALCRDKAHPLGLAPSLYCQSMESLHLPRQYRIIIVPSSTFQLITEIDRAQQALVRFHDHLLPGGLLVMPFMVLWEPGDPTSRDWKLLSEVVRPEDGAIVRRWARDWFDVENQLEHTSNRYEIVRDGEVADQEVHHRSPATRWYTQDEVAAMVREAGFTGLELLSGFSHEPAAEEETLFTILGRRP